MKKGIIKRISYFIPVKKWREPFCVFCSADIRNAIKIQDAQLTDTLNRTNNLIVFLVPEYSDISGGLMSIFTIAKYSRKFRSIHNAEVILATIPNKSSATYVSQPNFQNNEIVFRFPQITEFRKLRNLIIHVPEYVSGSFYDRLTPEIKSQLLGIESLRINILNQNIRKMPDKEAFSNLYNLTNNISQTVAYHRNATQEISNKYQLPTLFLQAFIDTSAYTSTTFDKKENCIAYSPDRNENKKKILAKITHELPQFKLIEIKNMKFEQYINIITNSKFSISFGDGFDGYLIEPFHKGSISFAVYNDQFFPSPEYKKYFNIFNSYEDMAKNIISKIKNLDAHPAEYKKLNKAFMEEPHTHVNISDYLTSLEKYYLNNFDFYPQN